MGTCNQRNPGLVVFKNDIFFSVLLLNRMGTDVRFVVDQFALCNRFASLGVTNPDNTLLPQAYGRVQTAYLKQNRKESFPVAYGDENKSYTFPESLRVLQRVALPTNGAGSYKTLPGLHIIKTIHIRCNGDLVYSTPYRTVMADHLASLRDESARAYGAAHLGYISGAASGNARVCWLPIPLPNSSIWRYGGRSQGALPFGSFKNNKIEITFDFYPNTYSAADRASPSPALTDGQIGGCGPPEPDAGVVGCQGKVQRGLPAVHNPAGLRGH